MLGVQSERIGFNTYKFRVDDGVYSVAVYLAEISGDDPSIDVNAEGLRRFTLIFNDDPNSPLQNLDPFKVSPRPAGWQARACKAPP